MLKTDNSEMCITNEVERKPMPKQELKDLLHELKLIQKGLWTENPASLNDIIQLAQEKNDFTILNKRNDPMFRFERIAARMEMLPIHVEDITTRPQAWMFFVLCDGEWWPCKSGSINRNNSHFGPVLNYVIEMKRSFENGSAIGLGTWAHCTADSTPCLDWEGVMGDE